MQSGVVGQVSEMGQTEICPRKGARGRGEDVKKATGENQRDLDVPTGGVSVDKGKRVVPQWVPVRGERDDDRVEEMHLGLDPVDGALFGGPLVQAGLPPLVEKRERKKRLGKSKMMGVRHAMLKQKRRSEHGRGVMEEWQIQSGEGRDMEEEDDQTISSWVSAEIARRSRRDQRVC